MRLSYREAATTDIHNDQSQLPENFPKQNQFIAKKPVVDVTIKIDPERQKIEKNIAMGLNALNQLEGTR